jgi:hypothetical protein
MFNIADYLEKFKNIGFGEKQLKEAIKLSVKEILNIDLETKVISLKNGEVIFSVSPAIKNAIFIKKTAILNRLKEKHIENICDMR